MVVWIIGLSGTGKTTLATHFVQQMRQLNLKVVLLDGDVIRSLFGNDVDYSIDGRRRNAERISYLSKFLSDQGINVVAAVLSNFPEWRRWNRANIKSYAEVYLKASMQTLMKRDVKNLYARAARGEIQNVVGIDIPFIEPDCPDLVIENDTQRLEFSEFIDRILAIDSVRRALAME